MTMDSCFALSYVRKESLDIYNRLHSIAEDASFVHQVIDAYPDTPIIPNLRCGAWYTDPAISNRTPAYFKSTDGHFNNWDFNLRRSNLHLLPLIRDSEGIIIVDSTRSGKRIPDALSKTIPIWCAVINRASLLRYPGILKRQNSSWDVALYTPPSIVSMQERQQIESRLDTWAQNLAASSFLFPELPRPLRPVWITPAQSVFPVVHQGFLSIICVSASKKIEAGIERRSGGFSYVQGSGDDHELWGMGLTPPLFWNHLPQLLAANRSDLQTLVLRIVADQQFSTSKFHSPQTPIAKAQNRLLLSKNADVPQGLANESLVYLILSPSAGQESLTQNNAKISLQVLPGKKGQSHYVHTILPTSMAYIREKLSEGKSICVSCESGTDLCVGVALAALQLFFTNDGSLINDISNQNATLDPVYGDKKNIDKASIRTRLQWIIASRHQANPSRSTLKRVNEYLLTDQSFRRSSIILSFQ